MSILSSSVEYGHRPERQQ